MIASKNQIPSLAYDDDPDTQSLLEDEEYNQYKNEVFLYLEQLRESGETNMFGAAAYIQNEFELDKKTSVRYLSDWMKNFKGEKI
tara:strand:+ start:784 stop:1038 length:255 start_codon:yes stop_codon:yes gene_type:complete